MTRRAIRRDEEQAIREQVVGVFEGAPDGLLWTEGPNGRLYMIEVVKRDGTRRGLNAREITWLAAVGIHPGADGWEIEEAPDIARPPLLPGFGWFQRGIDSYSLDGPNGTIAKAHHDGRSWTWSILSTFARTTARDLREAQERAEDACRAAGLFDAPTAPDLGAKVDALHDAAGAPPTGAALALYRLLCADAGEDEHGHHSDEAIGSTCAARAARRARLCEAFVAELRAASPMPAPRTTDGALTAYLLEHHREAWRPGEDALALAIRLLGDRTALEGERAAYAAEATAADENAKELGAELVRVRAALAKETERRIEAERGRGEALGDLAALRGGLRGLMARMGAPHG